MKIILASASPRRRELLEMLGVKELEIVPARGAELAPEGAGPGETVKALSRAKALEVRERTGAEEKSDVCILAADTVVYAGGRILGKPHSEAEAKEMLRSLSGRAHEVYTGITVCCGEACRSEFEVTEVRFRDLSEEEIDAYVATGEPMDKAGAYGIQGKASLFVSGIAGDYFNVVGLPLCRTGEMLKTIGVHLI